MARRPFIRRKKNETKNQEAIDIFNVFNRLAPSTRNKYLKTVDDLAEFLLIHRKSIWDADYEDLKKYLTDAENKQHKAKGLRCGIYGETKVAKDQASQ